jgi:hypothetical protein
MRKRLQTIERILAVQRQLQKKAEARLSELQRQEVALSEQEKELVQFLNGDLMPSGSLSDSIARRFRMLAVRTTFVRNAKEVQERQLLEQLRRVKRAERVADRLVRENRLLQDRKSLADLIERAVGPSVASLG